MTQRNHYPGHYPNCYHQIQMFSHQRFPSTWFNVFFIVCWLCCTKGASDKPIAYVEDEIVYTTITATTTNDRNILDHIIPSTIHKNDKRGNNHENISRYSTKRKAKLSFDSVQIKTVEQKINGEIEIMIPLFDENSTSTTNENVLKNSSSIQKNIDKRNPQLNQSGVGLYNDTKQNYFTSHTLNDSLSTKSTMSQITRLSSTTTPATLNDRTLDHTRVQKIILYPPLPAMIQMSRESAEEKSQQPKSSIAKFLQEPELGQSWYNRNGPTPTFTDSQINGTVYQARLGSNVFLDCQVTALEKDLVSWLKTETSPGFRLPILLTVGFRPPYASENRFMLDFLPPHNYRLRINNVQWKDEGKYLCQLAVHPPSLIWSRLHIIRPLVHLLDSDMNPVADLHYDVGTTIEMVCRVKRPPLFHVSVLWEVQRHHSFDRNGHEDTTRVHNDTISEEQTNETQSERTNDAENSDSGIINKIVILNQDVTRGGVKVDTGRDPKTGYIISRLRLANVQLSDIGNYTCRLSSWPRAKPNTKGLFDTISVHVLQGENTKAIHQEANGAPRKSTVSVFRFRLQLLDFVCSTILIVLVINQNILY